MRLDKAIALAILSTAPLYAMPGLAHPAAALAAPRTFTIVAGKDSIAGRGAFDRIARLATKELESKGYRAAKRGEVADMVVSLSYGGKTLRYRGDDLRFIYKPSAVNSTPNDPYPYPAGALPGKDYLSRPLSYGPAESDVFLTVAISSGRDKLFENSLHKHIASISDDRDTKELVATALQGFPLAES